MPSSNSKCTTPPANSPRVPAEAPSSSKAFVYANNELQKLSQQLIKANQREGQIHGTLKKMRANHFRAVAETIRVRNAIKSQQFIVENLKSQFGTSFSAPALPSQQKSPFCTPPPASASSACKNHRLNPYSSKTTRKLIFDNPLEDTSQDAELAKVLQDAEAATVTASGTKPQGGGKTTGETSADYADLTTIGEEGDTFNVPNEDEASA